MDDEEEVAANRGLGKLCLIGAVTYVLAILVWRVLCTSPQN